MQTQNCTHCGGPLTRSFQQKFCSQKCNAQARADAQKRARPSVDCAACGQPFTPRPQGKRTRTTCSKACRYALVSRKHKAAGIRPTPPPREVLRRNITGSNAPWWKGGRRVNDSGYIICAAPADFPFPEMIGTGNRIREHRMVMALHLGRPLEPGEVVHHVNGDRSDNRIENLELFASHSEHMKTHHGEE